MVITREKLREIAGTFLSKLKEEGITHEDVLISRLGCSFPMGGSKDFLEIALGSLEDGTRSRTASYVMRGFGKPLEIQINCVLGYSRIIVKCENRLERYSSFRYSPSVQAQSAAS